MKEDGFEPLAEELEALFAQGPSARLDDSEFEVLALRVFAYQFGASRVYRAFCEARGVGPGDVRDWRGVPAVPAAGFKHVDLLAGPGPEAVFFTSGTSRGTEARGRHPVARTSLYRAALRGPFRRWVVPDVRPRLLSLIPSPRAAPESSLSAMIGVVSAEMVSGTSWLADAAGLVDAETFAIAIASVPRDEPVLLVGTAFAFVHLLDGLGERSEEVVLPPGSRIMETGGFKGRSRTVTRDRLRADMHRRLGVAPDRVVGEYGMTELLSQLYEPVLERGAAGAGLYVPPPWLRVRALDPVDLEEKPAGEPGILCFHDLANLGSVSVVLTEDVGTVSPDGVRLRGRTEGAEPRGCSLAVEELLDARGRIS